MAFPNPFANSGIVIASTLIFHLFDDSIILTAAIIFHLTWSLIPLQVISGTVFLESHGCVQEQTLSRKHCVSTRSSISSLCCHSLVSLSLVVSALYSCVHGS